MQVNEDASAVSRISVPPPPPPEVLVPATSYPALVGAVLVELREHRGLTQADLATQMGLAASTWSRIENGSSALSIDQLALVAKALGVRPGEILQHADRVQDVASERKVRVEPERISSADAVTLGLAVLGGAALGTLIAVAVAAESSLGGKARARRAPR